VLLYFLLLLLLLLLLLPSLLKLLRGGHVLASDCHSRRREALASPDDGAPRGIQEHEPGCRQGERAARGR
jgi:hypothetical protein